jgi:hypothetical protein
MSRTHPLFVAILGLLALAAVQSVPAQQQAAAEQAGPDLSDPNQIKDALERVKARGKLIACADPYDWPYSSNAEDPPGSFIEIIRPWPRSGSRLEMYWPTPARAAASCAPSRNSILAKRFDVFLGLSDNEMTCCPARSLTDAYTAWATCGAGRAEGRKIAEDFNRVERSGAMLPPIDDYHIHEPGAARCIQQQPPPHGKACRSDVDPGVGDRRGGARRPRRVPMVRLVPLDAHRFSNKFAGKKTGRCCGSSKGHQDLLVATAA